jgi:hypothetical protein
MAAEDVIAITKARSMLIILVASCEQTLLALEAAGNVLERGMADDLRLMIARSTSEIEALNKKLEPAEL